MELQIVGLALVACLVLIAGVAGIVIACRALRKRMEERHTASSSSGEV